MASTKFKMPTDAQIWAEVDARLDATPEVLKSRPNFPTRQKWFDDKKAYYEGMPARLEKEAEEQKNKEKMAKEADEAYLALRKQQGKPIVTLKELVAKYPKMTFESSYTQQKLHETAEILEQISVITAIAARYQRLEAATRSLQLKYLSQAYGIYRTITKSEVADETFKSIRGALWHVFNIKTHEDVPRSTLLLKMIFRGALEKTYHLYSRCFLIADSYDIEPGDFENFIKELGGMEKIRKAYATVIAADAGKLVPKYVKQSEEYASMQVLAKHKPYVVQMGSGGTGSFKNDILNHYCLILARKATMDQLELYCPLPSTTAIENYVLKWIGDTAKDKNVAGWFADKDFAVTHNLKRGIEEYLMKEQMKQEKAAAKKKKDAARAKKDAADAKRFEKQRTNLKSTK